MWALVLLNAIDTLVIICLIEEFYFVLLTIELDTEGGSGISETKLSFCVIDDRDVMGDAFAEVTGVTAELPFVLAFAIAFLVASFTS